MRTTVDGTGPMCAHPRGTPRTVVEVPVLVRHILEVILRAWGTREVHRAPLQPFHTTCNTHK